MGAQSVLDEIRQQGFVTSADGEKAPIENHGIDASEARFLVDFVASHPEITQTLEIGCAYGFSSLCIASGVADRPGAHHTIVDPFQSTFWKGIGVANLDRAGIDHYELREEPSELELPQLVREGAEFDLIFIDGYHTFDHTLIDLFYANRLVKVGGYVIIDDVEWPSVAKAVSYFMKYPCYKKVGGSAAPLLRAVNMVMKIFKPIAKTLFPHVLYDYVYRFANPSMVALHKVSEDNRNWKWFRSF